MEGNNKKGYAWAISAGLNAALAAVSAKLITPQIVRYGLVILLNATMWGCYVNSLKAVFSASHCHKFCCKLPVFWSSWILFVPRTLILSGIAFDFECEA
ncbi:hypothetical protein ACE6H2_023272 [Prunus campanulata]